MSDITNKEWERRFKARFCERLQPYKAAGHKGHGWTQAQAERAAQREFEALPVEANGEPEDEADESLSYWGDGV
jgi:hypothetical protein